MTTRWTSAAICGAIAGFGYAIGAFAILFATGGESLPTVVGVLVVCAPLVWIAGGFYGAAAFRRQVKVKLAGTFGLGLAAPLVGYWFVLMFLSAQDSATRVAYDARSRSSLEAAKKRGFPFPEDAEPGMEGQAWSRLSIPAVRDFYGAALEGRWEGKQIQNTSWYVREAGAGRYDRIWIRKESSRAAIYFGTIDRDELEKMAGSAFSQSVGAGNWEAALSWCEPSFARKLGISGLKRQFADVKPDSSAFARGSGPYPIAFNAKLEEGRSRFRTVEVGLSFDSGVIPLIREIRIPR